MKLYDLDIITADKKITFTVQEAETDQEASIGLSYLDKMPENQGMIYFSRHPEYPGHPCMNARMNTSDTKFPVDFIFVDSIGNIKQIDKNVPALSSDIHTTSNVVAVIEVNAGVCDKFDICKGDSVIHQKFRISADNQIKYDGEMFDKIVQRTFNKINSKNIAFFAIAEGGAMGWAGAIQIITKEDDGSTKWFFIDSTGISDFKEVEKLFPPLTKSHWVLVKDYLDDPEWEVLNMGFGNHLYIRKDFSKQFFEELQDKHPYQNWVRIAKNLLK